jgi:DNA replication and repair protein RecF
MLVQQLSILNTRNILHAAFEPHPALNLIIGPNASGKTSVLEAIAVLATARSFRGVPLQQLITHNQKRLKISGAVHDGQRQIRLSVSRENNVVMLKVDDQRISSAAQLASILPVQVLHPGGYRLLELGPSQRRRFLDWGVFHVEPRYQEAWQRYARALKQRNAALRSQRADQVSPWNSALQEAAQSIHVLRQAHFDLYKPILLKYIDIFMGTQAMSIDYRPGWPLDKDFESLLGAELARDMQFGYTRFGPHRADLVIRADHRPAQQQLSRGQQKLLVTAMQLAQAELLKQATQRACIFLVDDLAAELDRQHRQTVFSVLEQFRGQVFVTGTELELLPVTGLKRGQRTFHMEHGEVCKVV